MSNVRIFSLNEIIKRLEDRNLKMVSRRTGISYPNLRDIAIGKVKNPRYSTVDKLREYLSESL
jgi:predicted transcriptional regulator